MHSVLIPQSCHTDNELELKSKKRISQNCVFNPSPNSDLFSFSQVHMYPIRIKSGNSLNNKNPQNSSTSFFYPIELHDKTSINIRRINKQMNE